MANPRELAALRALSPDRVKYLPASWEKRFARTIAAAAERPDFEPSEKQWPHIRRLAHRYRRQAPVAHAVLCGECADDVRSRPGSVPLFESAC